MTQTPPFSVCIHVLRIYSELHLNANVFTRIVHFLHTRRKSIGAQVCLKLIDIYCNHNEHNAHNKIENSSIRCRAYLLKIWLVPSFQYPRSLFSIRNSGDCNQTELTRVLCPTYRHRLPTSFSRFARILVRPKRWCALPTAWITTT